MKGTHAIRYRECWKAKRILFEIFHSFFSFQFSLCCRRLRCEADCRVSIWDKNHPWVSSCDNKFPFHNISMLIPPSYSFSLSSTLFSWLFFLCDCHVGWNKQQKRMTRVWKSRSCDDLGAFLMMSVIRMWNWLDCL